MSFKFGLNSPCQLWPQPEKERNYEKEVVRGELNERTRNKGLSTMKGHGRDGAAPWGQQQLEASTTPGPPGPRGGSGWQM